MRLLLAAVALIGLSTAASAASFMETGATMVGDTGNIVGIGGPSISSINVAYNQSPTVPASEWVWIGDIDTNNAASWQWNFDLTGFDATTAAISGLWWLDNTGTATLNGTAIASGAGFTSLLPFNYSGLAFVSGANSLVFDVVDLGGPGAFRAALTITADADVDSTIIPLPASLPLALGGLAALGAVSRRTRQTA